MSLESIKDAKKNMTMNSRLEELKEKVKNYQFIIDKLSNPYLEDKERFKFTSKYNLEIGELTKITNEISEIKWRMMSSQEQKDYIEKYSED